MLAFVVLLALSGVGAGPAFAEESKAPSSPNTEGSQENKPQPEAQTPRTSPSTGSERRRAGDKGGVFRPTEDISEDIAITFPVDI